jgi:anti-sigma factor RsiW
MMADDLENDLRDLRFRHLSEIELTAYCEGELAPMRRARVEAHLKHCFICERELALLREEIAVLSNRQVTAADVRLVERLAEYLRQMAASWRTRFAQGATRGIGSRQSESVLEAEHGAADQGEEVWRWQSEDGKLRARAALEGNGDLAVHLASGEDEMDGLRLNMRIGPFSQEFTLRRVSKSEVAAKVVVARRQRPRKLEDIAVEII